MSTVSDQSGCGSDETGREARQVPSSYEAALAELEALVTRMESGDLSLEASLAAYRRGAALVSYCQQQLEKAEQQVRVLDGETLKPLTSSTTSTPVDNRMSGVSAAGEKIEQGDDDF